MGASAGRMPLCCIRRGVFPLKKAYIAQCVFAALLVALGIALSIEVFGEMNLAFIRVLGALFSAALLGNLACALTRLIVEKKA